MFYRLRDEGEMAQDANESYPSVGETKHFSILAVIHLAWRKNRVVKAKFFFTAGLANIPARAAGGKINHATAMKNAVVESFMEE